MQQDYSHLKLSALNIKEHEKTKRRFTSMHAQFNTMISPSPEAYERIELPSGMQP